MATNFPPLHPPNDYKKNLDVLWLPKNQYPRGHSKVDKYSNHFSFQFPKNPLKVKDETESSNFMLLKFML